jgi:hypothetical protein
VSSDEWDAVYRASGELHFRGAEHSRRVEVPDLLASQWVEHPDSRQVTFCSARIPGVIVGFTLHFKDSSSRRLEDFYVIQPRFGGGSVTYGIRPSRRALKWERLPVGKRRRSRMDRRFYVSVLRPRETAWEVAVEAQDPKNPPPWLTSGVFRLEVNALERPWQALLASFETTSVKQSAHGRIELTLAHRGPLTTAELQERG